MTAHDTVRTIMRGIIVRGLLITLVIAVLATAVGYFVAGIPGVLSLIHI